MVGPYNLRRGVPYIYSSLCTDCLNQKSQGTRSMRAPLKPGEGLAARCSRNWEERITRLVLTGCSKFSLCYLERKGQKMSDSSWVVKREYQIFTHTCTPTHTHKHCWTGKRRICQAIPEGLRWVGGGDRPAVFLESVCESCSVGALVFKCKREKLIWIWPGEEVLVPFKNMHAVPEGYWKISSFFQNGLCMNCCSYLWYCYCLSVIFHVSFVMALTFLTFFSF